ncbi:MAG: DUF3040 domain-containing protein [Propionicimonas sp.]
MALSEDEQRLLEQMEAALEAEDPKLANALRGTTSRRLHRRRAALAGIGFLVGVGLLIGGMEVHWALSIAGFLIMLVSTVVAVSAWQHVGYEGESAQPRGGKSPESDFMDKLEERWRHRNEDGL